MTTAPATTPDIDWRLRAAQAEERLRELEDKLAGAERALGETRTALDAAERRRSIERELAGARAVDLETAVVLAEAALAAQDHPDIPRTVADLRRRKPFLFAEGTPGAMGAVPPAAPGGARDAAAEARATGDRRALLRYLRLKRGA